MPNTIRLFRDRPTIDHGLIANLGANPADTLVFGAREVVLAALSPSYDYVIAADQLTVLPNAGTSLVGDSPNATVLAAAISGALQIICAGIDGVAGAFAFVAPLPRVHANRLPKARIGRRLGLEVSQ